MTKLRSLVDERIALLRLLGVVPVPALAALIAAMLLAAFLPAATALAVAWLVGRVGDRVDRGVLDAAVIVPLVVVGVLLALDQVTQSLIVPFRNWIAARVNGEIRRTVRRAVSVRSGIEHLELQVVRDAAALPTENAYLFNLGVGLAIAAGLWAATLSFGFRHGRPA